MKRTFLEEFHKVAYKYLGRAKDATFELTDAILLCNFRPLTKSPQGITTNTTIRSDRPSLAITIELIDNNKAPKHWYFVQK